MTGDRDGMRVENQFGTNVFGRAEYREQKSQLSQMQRPEPPAVSGTMRPVSKQRITPISYLRAITGGTAADEARFAEKMGQRMGAGTHLIPVGRARSGIYLLVKHTVAANRRKVILSPFTIPDVVTMVVLAGGEPVFFDFEPGSTAADIAHLRTLIGEDTACVMVTHHHVNEPRLPEIAALCRANGARLFDDCAIAFGGTYGQQPIGTVTDASVFSFSSFKQLNYFWGGMISTRDGELADRLKGEVETWPRLAARDYLRPAKGCITYDVASRPLVFAHLMFPLFQRRARRTGAVKTLENIRIETETLNPSLTSRPSTAAFGEWSRKLDNVDGWIAHRRAIAAIYRERLGRIMVTASAAQDVIAGSCFANFPVVVDENRCGDICRDMLLSGFDAGRNLYPNCHTHPKFTGVAGASVNVGRLTRSTIYLPTHFGVTPAYATGIAARLEGLLGPTGEQADMSVWSGRAEAHAHL
jgi:perosamine synthetase